jgi:hypothetical protein
VAEVSLLNRGTDTVKVFQEVQAVEYDSDGNRRSRPSLIGTLVRAVVQPVGLDRIGATAERQDIGFYSESRYRLRLINYPNILGAQSQIEWQGRRYSIDGEARVHNGSPRTRHVDYVMVRS